MDGLLLFPTTLACEQAFSALAYLKKSHLDHADKDPEAKNVCGLPTCDQCCGLWFNEVEQRLRELKDAKVSFTNVCYASHILGFWVFVSLI